MKLFNGLFAHAVEWIFENTEIKDQKTLAAFTGITETTISRILNDKVKKPSVDTIKKLNDAFDGLFNLAYFSGASVILLNADAAYFKQHPEKSPLNQATVPEASASVPSPDIPAWADSLINLVSQNTAIIHDLRVDNAQLREAMIAVIEDNKKLRKELAESLALMKHKQVKYQQEENILPMAAEPQSSNNK